jgi:hypothetical protein
MNSEKYTKAERAFVRLWSWIDRHCEAIVCINDAKSDLVTVAKAKYISERLTDGKKR